MSSDSFNIVTAAIARLRSSTHQSIQHLWRYNTCDLSIARVMEAWDHGFNQGWSWAIPNSKGHLSWEQGRQARWFAQTFIIPDQLTGYPLAGLLLRLKLTWWAEQADIFVDGQLVQQGDLFDHTARIVLATAVPGKSIHLAIRLVSPEHDSGALVHSDCLYEFPSHWQGVEPGFIADELEVVLGFVNHLAPEQLDELSFMVNQVDWKRFLLSNDRPFQDSILQAFRQTLQPFSEGIKQRHIALLGFSHLDLAWLWPAAETWDVARRTFSSAVNLIKKYPELIVGFTSPVLYAWLEQHHPHLFAAIQSLVHQGRWEMIAGLWVEPECNLISGESLTRQVLYGQRYLTQKFGNPSRTAWLPDSFGFCWQLPQILRQGGFDYFITQKLRWNDTNSYPHELFWWQSPDGTSILSLMSAPIGEGIEPVKMAHYLWEWEKKTGIPHALWLPGVGDHGGGPTEDMLEIVRRWQHSSLFPKIEFCQSVAYLDRISQEFPVGVNHSDVHHPLHFQSTNLPNDRQLNPSLPIHNRDLYLEFHRGCYTSHGDQKWWNRRCEGWLYQAELWSSLASFLTSFPYPQTSLEQAWKLMLFNQFHDILPGSSIPQVFADANRDWEKVRSITEVTLHSALESIAQIIHLSEPLHPQDRPFLVFNCLNWERSQVVSIPLCDVSRPWFIYDYQGRPCSTQMDHEGQLLLQVESIPSIGYRLYWLSEYPPITQNLDLQSSCLPQALFPSSDPPVLETDILRVTLDPQTGNIADIYDKLNQRSVLDGVGNELQAFQDCGQYWDAWNIDPHYADHPLPPPQLESMECREYGPLSYRWRIVRRLGQSWIQQDYLLRKGSSVFQIETLVDWQEDQTLLKTAFPLAIHGDWVTYEVPYGAITRRTQPITPQEKAEWEVPALQWADLSDGQYGISLLNDCKYGHDAQPNQLRLTLLRSPNWPDPRSDRGRHHFTYALYPHRGSWQSANTVREGYALNQPLTVWFPNPLPNSSPAHLPPESSFLSFGCPNVILSALKQSEANPDRLIMRCYECHGELAHLYFMSCLPLRIGQIVSLVETPLRGVDDQGSLSINPWTITSYELLKGDTP